MNFPFVVLEGVDGSGKTSVAQELCRSHGYTYVKTPAEYFRTARKYIDDNATPDGQLHFYIGTVLDASRQIAQSILNGPVVCDRYIYSTLVTHSVYNKVPYDELRKTLEPVIDMLLQPDHTALLVVNEKEQLRRILEERDPACMSASDKYCMDSVTRSKVHELYLEVAQQNGWQSVDTSTSNQRDVAQQIAENLEIACR